MTNYERIRNMTVDEMALFLCGFTKKNVACIDRHFLNNSCYRKTQCLNCAKKYLENEVK